MEPRVPAALPLHEQQTTGQSFLATDVKRSSLPKMLKVVATVAEHIIKESNGAVLEEAKILSIKNCLKSHGAKWPLEFIGPSKS
jgi:hypothetical protein